MKWPGFIGPSARSRSRNVSNQESVNLIIEKADSGTPKVIPWSTRRPRLTAWIQLASAPVRQLYTQDGRAFAISGDRFYELFASQTAIERGTVAVDTNPATIVSNGAGHQLFIVSGGGGYIFDTTANTFVAITDGDFTAIQPVIMGDFLNSYFLVLKSNSRQFNWSALLDGLDWAAIDVGQISQTPDLIRKMLVSHGNIYFFGSQNTAVWWNVASGNTVFQPIDDAKINMGIAGPWAGCRMDNTIYWLAENEDGGRMVMRFDGFTPVRVSTHSIEFYLNSLSQVADAIAWTYQEEGHTFWLLYLPVAEYTLVYDVSSQAWTKWSVWDPDVIRDFPYLGRCHTYAFDTHLVGDRQSGTVYRQVLEPGNDNFISASGL